MVSDPSPSSSTPEPPADSSALLPIRRVVLFKHGLGAFERQGIVRGDQTIRLGFQARELNDVLKSMTAFDRDGGRIASIGYESGERLEHKLERVHLTLGENDALTELLRQIKGAEVEVALGTGLHVGTVVGVEKTHAQSPRPGGPGNAGGGKPSRDRLTLLGADARLRTFDLLEVTTIRLLDPALQEELGYLLRTLFAAQREDRKHISIAAHGDGDRELVVHYVIEAPVWKTSYRILLSEDQPIQLQGWALVDNTQEEDWSDVELNLIAGLPISFTHDLQTPRRQQRPNVAVDEAPAYAPPELEQAAMMMDEDEMLAEGADFGAPVAAAAAPMKKMRSRALSREERGRSMADVQTTTRDVGNLIEYRIDHPVTVRRGESALVPLLQNEIGGERVLIYNPEVRDRNPMAAVWLHNTTGITLEGGPATVLDGSGADYVGEAMLETLVANDRQLVPYSVELGCVVSIDRRSHSTDIESVRLQGGQLVFERYQLNERIYQIHNKLTAQRKILIDHRFARPGELVGTEQPIETTENFYRFECTVPASSTKSLTVTERSDAFEVHDLRHLPIDVLGVWIQGRHLPDPILQQLEILSTQRAAVDRLQQRGEQLDAEIHEAFTDQERLRNNLSSLGSSESERGLRDRYVHELEASEDRLKTMRGDQHKTRQERDAAQHALESLLASLDLHAKT